MKQNVSEYNTTEMKRPVYDSVNSQLTAIKDALIQSELKIQDATR
jgi:hypothetical protein